MPEKITVDPVVPTPNENESKRNALSQPGPTAPAPAKGSLFANPKARLVLVILVLLVIGGVIYYVTEVTGYETTDDAQVDGHLMPLSARVGAEVVLLEKAASVGGRAASQTFKGFVEDPVTMLA